MEEEVGIKVTRLRRRLSVEADDVKSPSTQSTPTKKRGGRLAAKPQLELIDENAPDTAPKRTRKSTTRDIAEPVEEKVVTPSRRSTRIRSNTSIVSETPDVAEDKGTPSRRSTRIKSNTSIVAETVQNVNSPRAKRAARRTSLAGSDNEAPITPARQTRRTRKDSTSSIDKQAETNAGKIASQVNEVIVEESENNNKDTKSTDSPKNESPIPRKSPRLVGKTVRKSFSLDNDNKENEEQIAKETTKDVDKTVSERKADQPNYKIEGQKTQEENNLSVTSSNLIQELDEVPKKGKSNMNKSTTAAEEHQIKSKRNRTKSWTTISVEPSHDNTFCSDSEAYNKNEKKKNNTLNLSKMSGSGDGIMNMSNNDDENKEQNNVSLNLSDKKKKKRRDKSITENETSLLDVSVLNSSTNKSAAKISKPEKISKIDNGEMNDSKTTENDISITDKLLGQTPSGVIQSLVFEDSDSNHSTNEKGISDKEFDSGDQCVPVVDHHLENDETPKEPEKKISYEPMDIDETMPENVSLSTFTAKNNSINLEESKLDNRKSILNISQVENDSINNKSKRKSELSNAVSEEHIDSDSNKSKRKSSLSHAVSEDTTDGISNTLNHVDTDSKDASISKKTNKFKRNSSISNFVSDNQNDEDSFKSARKSSITDDVNDDSIKKVSNKSKINSSISHTASDDNKQETSNISIASDLVDEENVDKNLNKSKRKLSVSVKASEVSMEKENASVLDLGKDDHTINKSSNMSKRKSSISKMIDSMDNKSDKSVNKSVLATETPALDKTDNENKSTLVLSQLKDMSESELNAETKVPKESNESNEQLSKSVDVLKVNTDKNNKKDISLTYSTSTPLQQKSMKKLGLQINSSIIAPNSANKVINNSQKEASVSENDSEEEEEDSEEESVEKSKMIDDEAEEASDDYESGDSRDNDEKEYEEQNNIVEKGETLESEDQDYSDDSDYEKGSFIVSSDEEDHDLLSGSDDDLSMSDNELSMSKKSKKKYNERKIKEQKKASREMYDARHKLNESDKSAKSKPKKNNRQRFESSSESDNEVSAQPKKNKRQRIDSSQDISMVHSDADKSLTNKKKKDKRLSESVCEENATNEKEITIQEETQDEKIDPLTLKNVVKEEPKTPQKDLNISTVAVTNVDEVEEVNVDENVSIMKSNQTSDPLQATIADDDDENEDSFSENEEITQNYESVLNNLNKSNSKKIKSNISLNLNKKSKQKAEPIVDQLNLTQAKKLKTKNERKDTSRTVETKKLDKSLSNKSSDKMDKQVNIFSEGSSDSIDMKLLFPEDSNDSVEVVWKAGKDKIKKTTESTEKDELQETPEDFIPLKRTQGKTNILENIDNANESKDESFLNVSSKKKNKRNMSQTKEVLAMNNLEDDNVGFFIDTTGAFNEVEKTDINTSVKNSAKKNNVSFVDTEEAKADDDSNDAPLEVSYRSEKNKSKQDLNTTQNNEEMQDNGAIETPSQSAKKKKKNKKGLNNSQNEAETSIMENTDYINEKTINISATNVEGNGKKKKRISDSQIEQQTENGTLADPVQNISLGSAKKSKQKTVSESVPIQPNEDHDINKQEEKSKKRKRRSSAVENQTIEEITFKDEVKLAENVSLTTNNQKKKRKISSNDEDIKTQVQASDVQTQRQKKAPIEDAKKKSKALQYQEVDEICNEATKKNKKRKERVDDDASKISKILKQNSFDKVHVPRLPANVLKHLDDKPKEDIIEVKRAKVISTSSFIVEETKKRKNKPSNYLEESVYLNDDLEERRHKGSIKNPKVLPFIPTASTSDSGFTTKFMVNTISQETKFVAQSSDITNFKNDYLHKKRIKKLGTFEMYKRQRNIKISKF